MNPAKKRRIGRFFAPGTKRGILLPIDHGLTLGPIAGLESISKAARLLKHSEINAVIAHKGCLERLIERDALSHAAAMLHLNGMTSLAEDADQKEVMASMETAIALGVDGVSLQLNFTGRNDAHNLRMLGAITDKALSQGMPVLTMLYDKVPPSSDSHAVTRLRHLLRAVTELGGDMIKIALPSSAQIMRETFADVTDDVHIFVAGGTLAKEADLLKLLDEAVKCGASGFCIGRNIFERPNMGDFLQKLHQILYDHPGPIALRPAYGARG